MEKGHNGAKKIQMKVLVGEKLPSGKQFKTLQKLEDDSYSG